MQFLASIFVSWNSGSKSGARVRALKAKSRTISPFSAATLKAR
jgi:hypothetical protein